MNTGERVTILVLLVLMAAILGVTFWLASIPAPWYWVGVVI